MKLIEEKDTLKRYLKMLGVEDIETDTDLLLFNIEG